MGKGEKKKGRENREVEKGKREIGEGKEIEIERGHRKEEFGGWERGKGIGKLANGEDVEEGEEG